MNPLKCIIGLLAVIQLGAASDLAFTVSMEQPSTHYYNVTMRCDGLNGATQDFKMPAWTPGYYRIMDYARNVVRFRAEDGAGHPLEWSKTAKNTWRVKTANAPSIVLRYDVYAFTQNVADSFLDDSRGYVTPAGLFLHAAGQIQHPVTVTFQPYAGWSSVATGLDPVPGRTNTFTAPDFDLLYDCPILLGNQERLQFEVRGVPHYIAMEDVGPAIDRQKLVSDLKRMVETASGIAGEIPYKHYTFLAMGAGNGGIEHLTSAAMMFQGPSLENPAGYLRWLSYVAHEYFHTYNVKRIRPIALGPFDYDQENYTNMLWVSEGFTVYYQDAILLRAGLMTREQYFDKVRGTIARYENGTGHLFQSATESSMDTWIKFFARGENLANTTISYYEKGAALGLLLDLKIRHETGNKKSLDDVMRALYQEFFQERRRGFTDEEFRRTCEKVAGTALPEIFEYASTVREIDYPKYFGYGGLEIDVTPKPAAGAYLGAVTQTQEGSLTIASVTWDSPAQRSGLSAQDQILAVDGARVTAKSLDELLAAKKPGDQVRILIARHNKTREVPIVLGQKLERSFRIKSGDRALFP